ncbi:(d)CMP kinase [Enterococcus hulanensis]|uniref:Cytidylate kinase n=1 Tax=Enterococcus hulanensis TaxID=2559929 RepID=A0ABU3F570_9ENTE|nr:(d)CMP kinase [Enterococcus hulanensis]MDT2602273.1 (d)CMP kinase [Enterococcus hulanensis]MDT2611668.1 (d)CMP kinase [Enterococcus hulanensis]MDT2618753.1 (d)CMP kinase [Enterococcus hulanensis]MDT2630345.1 (d)CMP kinase [Enterococcus hulanensis]MDT2657742.1 (d)CMP kinase [Enterococcus hulanensis]
MEKISIAIDGPASSGKSTVAKILASDFNFIYVDTGAMYRAITFLAIKHQVAFSNEKALADLTRKYPITFKQSARGQLVFADGEEITQAIRQTDVTAAVSEVSAHGEVRAELVEAQRQLAEAGGVVMDGRDIGTTVLPKAQVKIFLVASVEERAQRRYKENQEKGIEMDFEAIKEAIAKRDYLDSHREVSPLVQAADAELVDTTGMSIEQVVTKIKEVIYSKGF